MTQTIGIAWFLPDQWERLRTIAPDPDRLENTYEAWLSYAQQQFDLLKSQGLDVRKVIVDVDELVAWCNAKKLPVSGESRSHFVANRLQEASKQN